jgi:hypothetical protein
VEKNKKVHMARQHKTKRRSVGGLVTYLRNCNRGKIGGGRVRKHRRNKKTTKKRRARH